MSDAIAKMCRYVTDDGAVAGYFQIDRAEVERIRAGIRTRQPKRYLAKRSESNRVGRGHSDDVRMQQDGREGSYGLKIAILSALDSHARAKRITRLEAGQRMISRGVK